MKTIKLTSLFILLLLGSLHVAAQLNLSTGVDWGELGASEPLLLNENFQSFTHNHTDENTDMGNSQHEYATDGFSIIYGYFNGELEVPIIGSQSGKIKYTYQQCAFAPDWQTAYAFKNASDNTPNVSNGFVEISRQDSNYSAIPTIRGYFTVDLRAIDFVEVIQWTHSSTGGNKRGVMCEISLDDGTTWDTLRYQPGVAWTQSFTKDPSSGFKLANGYRCDDSAYGMTWEDGIYTGNVIIRFREAGGQTPRIHDLKVYGTYTPPVSANSMDKDELNIYAFNRKIKISEPAKVAVFNIAGFKVKEVALSNLISMDDMPAGIYMVKAQSGSKVKTSKIHIQ